MKHWMFATALVAAALAARPGGAAAQPAAPGVAADPRRVNLLAMGDWGRPRSYKPAEQPATQPAEQSTTRPAAAPFPPLPASVAPLPPTVQEKVAQALARYVAARRQAEAGTFYGMLLVGDNFYVKLKGIDDPQWQTLFEKMYDPARLNFPFYAVLGNHDYNDKKDAIELAYAAKHPESRWKLPARWYRLDLPVEKPLVTVFMLDSNKDKLTARQWQEQAQWLAAELAKPRGSAWTVVAAHHPLFSNGAHGDIGVLQTAWGPLLKKHRVDFYLCGHDHDLQHLEVKDWPVSFLLVGGGGAPARAMRRDTRGPFSRQVNGFAHLDFTPARALVRYVSGDGAELHAFERDPAGHVRVLANTGVDKSTAKPLKVIQGLDEAERMKREDEGKFNDEK